MYQQFSSRCRVRPYQLSNRQRDERHSVVWMGLVCVCVCVRRIAGTTPRLTSPVFVPRYRLSRSFPRSHLFHVAEGPYKRPMQHWRVDGHHHHLLIIKNTPRETRLVGMEG